MLEPRAVLERTHRIFNPRFPLPALPPRLPTWSTHTLRHSIVTAVQPVGIDLPRASINEAGLPICIMIRGQQRYKRPLVSITLASPIRLLMFDSKGMITVIAVIASACRGGNLIKDGCKKAARERQMNAFP